MIKKIIFYIIFSFFVIESQGQSSKTLDSLKITLQILLKKDQTFRKIYQEAETKFGKNSLEMNYFWEVVEAQDKILEKKLIDILDKYGWLGISQIGKLANTAQWAVLQHGSISSKEKYAPLLKESVLKKESQAIHYARLIDRMLVNANKPQLYGTQINYNTQPFSFYEIEDASKVNEKRKELGLGSIENFAKSRNIEWNKSQKK